jgi:tripartite-type tricarboxylate transporter receptor subunit TctC
VAVISAKRSSTLPDVAGMQEAGIAGINVISWSGVVAPAKTPKKLIDALNAHFNSILKDPDVRTFFLSQGYETAGGTPGEFGRLLAEEVATWNNVIRAAKIQFD